MMVIFIFIVVKPNERADQIGKFPLALGRARAISHKDDPSPDRLRRPAPRRRAAQQSASGLDAWRSPCKASRRPDLEFQGRIPHIACEWLCQTCAAASVGPCRL